MEPPRYAAPMLAPGAESSSSLQYLPSREERLPAVDDHVVTPETREELLNGRRLFASPAKATHAFQHLELSYVLRAHVASGYRGAVDLLTRTGHESDFAPDVSVLSTTPDPQTGGRQLEELAFEICSQQALKIPTEKTRELIRRGVRRVFCLLVEDDTEPGQGGKKRRRQQGSRLLEWSRETDGWSPVAESAVIEDRCLARPLPVRALLRAADGDEVVAEALRARGGRVFEQERVEGKAEGRAEGLITVLEARGLDLSTEQKARILACTDFAVLDRWLRRAVSIGTVEELFEK